MYPYLIAWMDMHQTSCASLLSLDWIYRFFHMTGNIHGRIWWSNIQGATRLYHPIILISTINIDHQNHIKSRDRIDTVLTALYICHPLGQWLCYLPSRRIWLSVLWESLKLRAYTFQIFIQYHVLVQTRTPMSFSSMHWAELVIDHTRNPPWSGNRPYTESPMGAPLSPQFFTNDNTQFGDN